MALIGGALLFTHVHTVAPYANVAAGVYIAHVVLGLDRALHRRHPPGPGLPAPRGGAPLAVGFAVFMTIESILLITYNEGLPWYIGYGTYNRWGREARLRNRRPLRRLCVPCWIEPAMAPPPSTICDRYTEEPVAIAADQPLQLLIGHGYEETAIPLYPTLTGAMPRRICRYRKLVRRDRISFPGQADFLKTTPALGARLHPSVEGCGAGAALGGGRMVMGYFDPWVTPIIAAVPPNELALYQCPMHDGSRREAGPLPLVRHGDAADSSAASGGGTARFAVSARVGGETDTPRFRGLCTT